MRSLAPQPTLVDQVHAALLAEISEGRFGPDARLIQEEIAGALGVSRQPVQQALLLLKSQGVLQDAPGRGLMVTPLDPERVRNLCEIRAALDGLASTLAAERSREIAEAEGPAYIARGRAAVKSRSIAKMVEADVDFHFFLYGLAGNPYIAESSAPHWTYLRRVMGELLRQPDTPAALWDEHEAILAGVVSGKGAAAERLAREHMARASAALTARMLARVEPAAPVTKSPARRPVRARASN